MTNFISVTNGLPYGNGKPYLETEVKYYGLLDSVYIFQTRKEYMKIRLSIDVKIVYLRLVEYAPQSVCF